MKLRIRPRRKITAVAEPKIVNRQGSLSSDNDLRGTSAGRLIRAATWAGVLFVATCAAVVSYEHIYDLGRAHGQPGAAGRLLPLSVDGTIIAAGLMLLHEARAGHEPLLLARVMLWSGIGATLGANLAYGWPYGILGALVSAWPAYAFLGITEAMMLLVRRMAPAPAESTPTAEIRQAMTDLPASKPERAVPVSPNGQAHPVPVPGAPEGVPETAPNSDKDGSPEPPEPPAQTANGNGSAAAVPGVPEPSAASLDVLGIFATDLAAGQSPTIRDIKRGLRIGTDRAREVQGFLKSTIRT